MTDPATPDPRDRRDDGLQDARDDSYYEMLAAFDNAQLGEASPDEHGLRSPFDDARDDSDPYGWMDEPPEDDDQLDPVTGYPLSWRDRFDTREEWEESR